jgi:alpha-D-ribose 1-methylphosphonate 5-triphosphate synthase subunit PhnG
MHEKSERQMWMGVLARADAETLGACWTTLTDRPSHKLVRAAEVGMVMLRGRAGGDGDAFNLGEMTVTRCIVETDDGTMGFGYVAGRDHRHAELAALFDALLQQPSRRSQISAEVIAPLAAKQASMRRRVWAEAAETRVDFFTVVRGEG